MARDEPRYELVTPFWVDGYEENDQFMFSLGFEFCTIVNHVRFNDEPLDTVVHRENDSRIRMVCGRFKRKCKISPCSYQDDPEQIRSHLTIAERG